METLSITSIGFFFIILNLYKYPKNDFKQLILRAIAGGELGILLLNVTENKVELAKAGKKINVKLSFLSDKDNSLLTNYINKKLKKKYYMTEIARIEKELKSLRIELKKKKSVTLERDKNELTNMLGELKIKYDKYKFSAFQSPERQKIHRNLKRIQKRISEHDENKKEYEYLKKILEYIE
ncbi:unnamed protein product [marine sediment metagenome]|uniref:Uncharacterized protein n=1 Tax=marine sediment metagenome TaxID=412755 RepID=X1DJP4_9ZZZZ